jgi:hypothetical protein
MAFYVNRTGQPEGPYEDQAIVQWIQSGQLRDARICPVGGSEWIELAAYPPFAQALGVGQAPATQSGWGGPPSYGQQPAQATAGYAPASGYGAQPGGYGPGAGGYGAPAPAKKTSMGLVIGLVAGLVLLLVGGGVAAYFLLGSASPQLAKSSPKDTELYLEVPSIKRTMLAAAGMDFVDATKLDDKKVTDDLVNDVAAAFDVSKDDARDIAWSLDSYAVAMRGLARGKPEGAMLFGFGSASAAEKLLASSRFTNDGTLGKSGKRYQLKRKTVDAKDASSLQRTLASMDSDPPDVLVWFAERKILAFGSEPVVTDVAGVIDDGKDSLEKSDVFAKAKSDFDSGASVVGFFDVGALRSSSNASARQVLDDYFKDGGPVAASMRFEDAGVVLGVRGKLSGPKVPSEKLLSSPSKLDVAGKLAPETVGYIAFSTKSGITGREAEDTLIDQLRTADQSAKLGLAEGYKQAMGSLEKESGLGFAKLYDMLGDHGAIAVQVAPNYRFDPVKDQAAPFKSFGATYVQHVKDKAIAAEVLTKIYDKAFTGMLAAAFKASKDGGGFTAEPTPGPQSDKLPFVRADLVDDYLILAIGSRELVGKSYDAFKTGKESLEGDKAHKSALKALSGDAHARLWVDSGRILGVALSAQPSIEAEVKKMGFDVQAIRTSGDDRMTSALAVGVTAKDNVFSYRVESLNIVNALPIAALAKAGRGGGLADDDDDDDAGGGGGSIGVAECDEYLRKMASCIDKMPAGMRSSMRDAMETTRDGWVQISKGPGKSALRDACAATLKSIDSIPYCK